MPLTFKQEEMQNTSNLMLVSTLEGKLWALNAETGDVKWEMDTGASLLEATKEKIKVNYGDKAVRLIPAIDGSLYMLGCGWIKPIPTSVDSSLNRTFRLNTGKSGMHEVLVDHQETKLFGVNIESGEIIYTRTQEQHDLSGAPSNHNGDNMLVVSRINKRIQTVDCKSGNQRWYFHVCQLKMIDTFDAGADDRSLLVDMCSERIQTDSGIVAWEKQIPGLVNAWTLKNGVLAEVHVFGSHNVTAAQNVDSPWLYLGMFEEQLYVRPSKRLQTAAKSIQGDPETSLTLTKCNKNDVIETGYYYHEGGSLGHHTDETPKMSQLSLEEELREEGLLVRNQDDIKEETVSLQKAEAAPEEYESRYLEEFWHMKCLGSGGYGDVFKARNKLDKKCYAVKRIALKESDDRTKTLREVEAHAGLKHDNIVRYHTTWIETPPLGWQEKADVSLLDASDSFPTASTASSFARSCSSNNSNSSSMYGTTGYLYIKMELCEDEGESITLKEWLSENPERDRSQMMHMFHQIVSAVDYIHGNGFMHRDLKPGNIFLGKGLHVKLGDFGLVVPSSDESVEGCMEAGHKHTDDIGTTLYISPEQEDKKDYGKKVDIFALGISLFELIYPFRTEMERGKVLKGVKKMDFPENFTKDKFYEFTKKLLYKDPDQRPSAKDILRDPLMQRYKEAPKTMCNDTVDSC